MHCRLLTRDRYDGKSDNQFKFTSFSSSFLFIVSGIIYSCDALFSTHEAHFFKNACRKKKIDSASYSYCAFCTRAKIFIHIYLFAIYKSAIIATKKNSPPQSSHINRLKLQMKFITLAENELSSGRMWICCKTGEVDIHTHRKKYKMKENKST